MMMSARGNGHMWSTRAVKRSKNERDWRRPVRAVSNHNGCIAFKLIITSEVSKNVSVNRDGE